MLSLSLFHRERYSDILGNDSSPLLSIHLTSKLVEQVGIAKYLFSALTIHRTKEIPLPINVELELGYMCFKKVLILGCLAFSLGLERYF
jgi:hypothetical protein